MAPTRIFFLRHAEEHGTPGVDVHGATDDHSLTVRGWQRAGTLARDLARHAPTTVFASKIGEGSETKRPQQTAGPLAALLDDRADLNIDHSKTEVDALMRDVLAREGTVVVVWEHSMLPKCLDHLAGLADPPDEWPSRRYDLVWSVERHDGAWTLTVEPQYLLAGDAGV